MAENNYPDDIQFAGLVQAATAAADERTAPTTVIGKRKRSESAERNVADVADASATAKLANSASVLFREPSDKSRKYSRPPLGKVYSSLELAPESFLRLQSAAKDFMLDDAHVERRDVVGHKKHNGNADTSRLKLWKCVEEFLTTYGNGERFFGQDAGVGIPDTPSRTFFWPEHSQKIIKLCMPLLRKMVTNERQRVYAADTRKLGFPKKTGKEQDQDDTFGTQSPDAHDSTLMTSGLQQAAAAHGAVVDGATQHLPLDTHHLNGEVRVGQLEVPSGSGLHTIHVNVVPRGVYPTRRLIPRFSLSSESATSLQVLRDEVNRRMQEQMNGEHHTEEPSIKVWHPDGLIQVKDDGEWTITLLSAANHEWLDGEVRVLIEL